MALCFFMFTVLACLASEQKDTIIFTGELSIDPLNRTSISKNGFSFLTSESWNLEKRRLTIHNLDLRTYKLSDLFVEVPTSIKILQCPALAMSDSFLLLQDDYYLKWFLFKFVQNEFKMVEEIQFPQRMMAFNAKVINASTFLFTDIYNHHPLDSVHNTSLAIYNAKDRKFIKAIHPDVPCIGLSHFPQNWITQNEKNIALAEPCGNLIQLYDMDLNRIRTISIPRTDQWIDIPGNRIPIETSPAVINPKDLISKFQSSLSTFSRIQTIHFANDSLLLISVSQPDSAGSTNLNFVYNLNSNKYIDSKVISISSSGYHYNCKDDLSFHIDPFQLLLEGISISLEEDNYLPDPIISTKENDSKKNQFYETHDPEFIIRISKINIR